MLGAGGYSYFAPPWTKTRCELETQGFKSKGIRTASLRKDIVSHLFPRLFLNCHATHECLPLTHSFRLHSKVKLWECYEHEGLWTDAVVWEVTLLKQSIVCRDRLVSYIYFRYVGTSGGVPKVVWKAQGAEIISLVGEYSCFLKNRHGNDRTSMKQSEWWP